MFRVVFVLYVSTSYALARFSQVKFNDTSENGTVTADEPNVDNMTEIFQDLMKSNSSGIQEMMKDLEKSVGKDPDGNLASRRFLKWFKTVVYSNSSSKLPKTTTAAPPYDDSLLIQKHLIAVLQNLTRVMDKLEKAIDMQNSLSPIRVMPLHKDNDLYTRSVRREKREVGVSEPNEGLNESNTIEVTEVQHSLTTSTTPAPSEPEDQKFPCTFKENVTRRVYQETNPEVKSKLLSYINDTFDEIEAKIIPVQEIKKTYNNNSLFRIGYIVANIDTLQVNMLNLQQDMEKHKSEWDDKKILDLFDKIKICNKAVTSLIASLNGAHDNTT